MGGPRVSIGMPVWNGERYIREGLDALLGQTFEDFELIISDNASTDATQAICEEYAARDPRVRYHRNPENVGLQGNFQRVLDLATAPYFMWGCPDDMWDPTYVERMVAILDDHPAVVLAGSNAGWIDQHGVQRGVFRNVDAYRGKAVVERVRRFLDIPPGSGHATLIYGLMRTSVIQRLGYGPRGRIRDLNRGYYAIDLVTLFRLLFEGEFHVVDETLYSHRDYVWHPPKARFRRIADGRVVWRLRGLAAMLPQMHGYYRDLRTIMRDEGGLPEPQLGALARDTLRREASVIPAFVLARVRRPTPRAVPGGAT